VSTSRGPLRYAGRIAAILLAAGFVALLAYGVLTESRDSTIDDSLARSRPVLAPAIDLPVLRAPSEPAAARRLGRSLSDGRITLGELRGAPVVLNLWASWCVPCREEAPVLERAWRAQGPGAAVFVGLDQQDIREDALRFLGELRVTYLNVRDRSNDVARRYGATGLPETFFISRSGRIVGHVIGVVSPAQLRDGIAAARSDRAFGVSEGGARRGLSP